MARLTTTRETYTMHTKEAEEVALREERLRRRLRGKRKHRPSKGKRKVGLHHKPCAPALLSRAGTWSPSTTTYEAQEPSVYRDRIKDTVGTNPSPMERATKSL
jgi:hypothetical protein